MISDYQDVMKCIIADLCIRLEKNRLIEQISCKRSTNNGNHRAKAVEKSKSFDSWQFSLTIAMSCVRTFNKEYYLSVRNAGEGDEIEILKCK